MNKEKSRLRTPVQGKGHEIRSITNLQYDKSP